MKYVLNITLETDNEVSASKLKKIASNIEVELQAFNNNDGLLPDSDEPFYFDTVKVKPESK